MSDRRVEIGRRKSFIRGGIDSRVNGVLRKGDASSQCHQQECWKWARFASLR
jgi:hypothetical protein